VQSARTKLQLFEDKNLDVTLYFAEYFESRNSERRSSVDEQINPCAPYIGIDWLHHLYPIIIANIIINYEFIH